ncbi:Glycosyltransferase involved in cell wall bisynthesis [Trichococcus flocculiformis]|uniref:glycosyltransferase family 2 protein n=1 Tax=Trichococcus TaxID=82802 RepID=UPI0007A86966|nr:MULTISPECIES: glycosyltransferase family 2 protein [Trichococcus]CZR10259.1 nucleotide-diphospho-sugar transferases [Trichococcus sp. ES5]SHG19338.1 Glycosyltransferase involved in cell wall bisynthesis [Trichococcus flocculiformis]
MNRELISIIVPCYNEEEMLPIFYEEIDKISKIMDYVTFEFIFVNDGSKDKTLKKLKELSKRDSRIQYYSFSRNFGKEAALFAGLEHSKGDYVAVMDVDLQDPPELLPEMYRLIQDEEYDCIGTRRKDREGEPVIRSFFARGFYRLINRISDTEIVDGARDFRLMKRQMVDAILNLTEYNRFSKGIFSWVGFETKYLEFQNKERVAGQTTWSFWSLLRYSLDGIVAFSEIPLAMASIIGFLTFAVAIVLAIFFGARTLIFGNPTSGWTSMIVIILALGGIQLLSLGIIGKYLGKTFLEAKKRPIYILKESSDVEFRKHKAEDNK